ncbi:MAG: LysM domain-containing protein [Opitutaceae bacterium]
MKPFLTFFVLAVVKASVVAAEPALELRGVLEGVGNTKLSLVDRTNDTTRWVDVGQSFAGFAVKAYDPATETATLQKDGKEIRLRINSAKIAEAPIAPLVSTGPISLTAARAIFNNLRQISAAADQYYLERGGNTTTVAELVGPTKYIKQLKPEAGEDYSALKLVGGKDLLSVTTASGETVTYDGGGNASSFYNVSPGDTLARIAQKTGSSTQKLVELNGITNPAQLSVGQPLRIK